MSASFAYPVQILRDHITGLEAAITVCLADPDHKPVHKLRTETRRVEALLVLLGLVPNLPEHRKQSAAMLRALAKLRRSAGVVRDLDVHRKMLEEFATAEGQTAEQQPAKAEADSNTAQRNGKGKQATAQQKSGATQNAVGLKKSAEELRKSFGEERDHAAAKLQKTLQDRQEKVAKVAQRLLRVLEPAEGTALPAEDLLKDAEAVLTRDGLLRDKRPQKLNEDELHSVRKAAKRARYLAESLPEDAALTAAAQRFEALQDSGGQWHDALELAQAARRHFGKAHELTMLYRQERDEKLKAYLIALSDKETGPAKERKSARKTPASKLVSAGKRLSLRKAAVRAA